MLKSYLSQLAVGTAKLKFDFSKGTDPYLTVSVVDSTGGETPLPGVLKVETAFGSTASATNTISLHFRITNTSDTPIDLSAVKLRYYYTEDGAQAQNFWCDWCSAGTSNVTGAFNSISAENADNYLEVGFAGGTGNLAAGDSVEIQIRIAKEDWSNYNQTNDYSSTCRNVIYRVDRM
nr:CBM_3 [uncultured Clostridium sp.]